MVVIRARFPPQLASRRGSRVPASTRARGELALPRRARLRVRARTVRRGALVVAIRGRFPPQLAPRRGGGAARLRRRAARGGRRSPRAPAGTTGVTRARLSTRAAAARRRSESSARRSHPQQAADHGTHREQPPAHSERDAEATVEAAPSIPTSNGVACRVTTASNGIVDARDLSAELARGLPGEQRPGGPPTRRLDPEIVARGLNVTGRGGRCPSAPGNRGVDQPFRPWVATPSMKYRWPKPNSSSIGSVTMSAATITYW